jgi:cyanophycinase
VAAGLTPGYYAGAAIAADVAILGGWRARPPGHEVAVCPEDAAEELDLVPPAPGLGLVPGCVDLHAAQWGTLAGRGRGARYRGPRRRDR